MKRFNRTFNDNTGRGYIPDSGGCVAAYICQDNASLGLHIDDDRYGVLFVCPNKIRVRLT